MFILTSNIFVQIQFLMTSFFSTQNLFNLFHINDTVNYEAIYNIIKERMNIPTPLLETVVMETGNKIHHAFPGLKRISISIKKMHPPIEGMQGAAEVSWHKEF